MPEEYVRKGDDRVYIVGPAGLGSVPLATLDEAELAQKGYRAATDDEVAKHLVSKDIKRETSWLGSAGLGLAEGVSAGLTGTIPKTPEAKLWYKAVAGAHPGWFTAGEFVGTAAPLAVPGGAAARAVTPVGLFDLGGQAAARLLAGKAPGVARRLAARSTGLAAEGGMWGAAQALGVSNLEDLPLTSEMVLSHAGTGALLGAILGVPVGAVEHALARRIAKARGAELESGQGLTKQIAAAIEETGEVKATRAENVLRQKLTRLQEQATELERGVAASRRFTQATALKSDSALRAEHSLLTLKVPELEKAVRLAKYGEERWKGVSGKEGVVEVTQKAEARLRDAQQRLADIEKRLETSAAVPAEVIPDRLISVRKEIADTEQQIRGLAAKDITDGEIARILNQSEAGVFKAHPEPFKDIPRPKMEEFPSPDIEPTPWDHAAYAGEGISAREVATIRKHPYFQKFADEKFLRTEIDNANDELTGFVQDLADAKHVITETHAGYAKLPDAIRYMRGVPEAQVDAAIETALSRLKSTSADLYDVARLPGQRASKAKEAAEIAEYTHGKIASFTGKDRGAKAAMELDIFKRRLGSRSKPEHYLGPETAWVENVRGHYKEYMEFLENPAFWGDDFANFQRETNAILHPQIVGEGHFNQLMTTIAPQMDKHNVWVRKRVGDKAKIHAVMGMMVKPQQSQQVKWLYDQLSREVALMRTVQRLRTLTKEQQDALTKGIEGTQRLQHSMVATHHKMEAARVFDLINTIGGRPRIELPIIGSIIGGTVGGGVGAAVGAVAGQAAMIATSPRMQLRWSSLLRRFKERFFSDMGRGAAKVRKVKVAAEAAGGLSPAERARRARIGKATFFEQLTEPGETEQDAYEKVVDALRVADSSPGRVEANVQAMFPGLEEANPELHKSVVADLRNQIKYLTQQIPTPEQDEQEKLLAPRPPVSDFEMDELARKFVASADPNSIFEGILSGELTGDEVDAIEATRPGVIAQARVLLSQNLAEYKDKLPWQQMEALGIALRVPTSLGQYPPVIQYLQDRYGRDKAEKEQGPKGGKVQGPKVGVTRGNIGDNVRTPVQRREAGVPPQ